MDQGDVVAPGGGAQLDSMSTREYEAAIQREQALEARMLGEERSTRVSENPSATAGSKAQRGATISATKSSAPAGIPESPISVKAPTPPVGAGGREFSAVAVGKGSRRVLLPDPAVDDYLLPRGAVVDLSASATPAGARGPGSTTIDDRPAGGAEVRPAEALPAKLVGLDAVLLVCNGCGFRGLGPARARHRCSAQPQHQAFQWRPLDPRDFPVKVAP